MRELASAPTSLSEKMICNCACSANTRSAVDSGWGSISKERLGSSRAWTELAARGRARAITMAQATAGAHAPDTPARPSRLRIIKVPLHRRDRRQASPGRSCCTVPGTSARLRQHDQVVTEPLEAQAEVRTHTFCEGVVAAGLE